jgi:hypothetical protein
MSRSSVLRLLTPGDNNPHGLKPGAEMDGVVAQVSRPAALRASTPALVIHADDLITESCA